MKKIFASLLIGFVTLLSVQIQAQTIEELKAERAQFKAELNSKDAVSREEKLAKLQEKAPGESGMQSIDGLALTSTGILVAVKSANDLLAQYKNEVKNNGDGEVEITTYKAKLSDYVKLGVDLLATVELIKAGTEQLKSAQADAKSLSPLKAKSALSSVDYSATALKLSGEEIAFQTKLVKNLIESIKASGNL